MWGKEEEEEEEGIDDGRFVPSRTPCVGGKIKEFIRKA